MEGQIKHGVLVQYDSGRGYGFIRVTENRNFTSFFLHVSQIVKGEPQLFAEVSFTVGEKRNGRAAPALNAEIGGIDVGFARRMQIQKGGVS
jgi:cold shock CspA family protein